MKCELISECAAAFQGDITARVHVLGARDLTRSRPIRRAARTADFTVCRITPNGRKRSRNIRSSMVITCRACRTLRRNCNRFRKVKGHCLIDSLILHGTNMGILNEHLHYDVPQF